MRRALQEAQQKHRSLVVLGSSTGPSLQAWDGDAIERIQIQCDRHQLVTGHTGRWRAAAATAPVGIQYARTSTSALTATRRSSKMPMPTMTGALKAALYRERNDIDHYRNKSDDTQKYNKMGMQQRQTTRAPRRSSASQYTPASYNHNARPVDMRKPNKRWVGPLSMHDNDEKDSVNRSGFLSGTGWSSTSRASTTPHSDRWLVGESP